ncbi:Flavohemoprotein (Hemoglobin-like protein) (Flavohemoglobin) (Nitric oxide dioxygenase) [Brachybacterium faecium]|nr:Flavohemoprotein (Hemoglobin-like protein) (Flavohemoglobin) (Nitric oxide dioxygenase) [Brachybacterium faecium]
MSVALAAARRPRLDLEAPLAPEHEQIVRDTLPLVGAHIEQIAPVFYRRMFTAHPELLRDTFNRGNQAQGAQQKALASSVATYATLLVTPDAPSPRELLSRIGHKHVSLGITEDQYGIVHEHLMAAIVEVLGEDAVTAEVAAAWDAVYWHMARTLISFETEMYADAGVEAGDVFREAVVVRRTEESSRVVSFDLTAPEGAEPLREFLPGQYISVGVVLPDGARQLRQYSLSDAPGEGRWRITVCREHGLDGTPDGEVSTWLHENLGEGDRLQVTLPAGDLTLDTASTDPVVLVSAGIGVTPMLGMLRHIAAAQPEREVRVLHADAHAADAALVRELAETVSALPAEAPSRLDLWFSRSADGAPVLPGHGQTRSRVSAGRMEITAEHLPDGAEMYLCGSSAFLQGAREQLRRVGADEERVHFELFSPNDWLLPGC